VNERVDPRGFCPSVADADIVNWCFDFGVVFPLVEKRVHDFFSFIIFHI